MQHICVWAADLLDAEAGLLAVAVVSVVDLADQLVVANHDGSAAVAADSSSLVTTDQVVVAADQPRSTSIPSPRRGIFTRRHRWSLRVERDSFASRGGETPDRPRVKKMGLPVIQTPIRACVGKKGGHVIYMCLDKYQASKQGLNL